MAEIDAENTLQNSSASAVACSFLTLISVDRYDDAIRLLEQRQNSSILCTIVNERGETVLHKLCREHMPVPVHIFRRILDASDPGSTREASLSKDEWFQMTPLIAGCSSRNFMVDHVHELLERFPESVALEDAHGYNALHHAILLCRSLDGRSSMIRSIAKVEALLATDPTLALDRGKTSPLALAADIFASSMDEEGVYQNETTIWRDDPIKIWSLLEIIISRLPGNTTLHKVCAHAGVTRSLLRFVLARCAEQTMIQDVNGNTPLHVTILSKETTLISLLVQNIPTNALKIRNTNNEIPFQLACRLYPSFQAFFGEFISKSPEMVNFDTFSKQLMATLLTSLNDNVVALFGLLKFFPELLVA